MALVDGEWTDANFVADALCLDFANTLGGRRQRRLKDRLTDMAALLDWFAAAGLLTPAERRRAGLAAARNPRDPAAVLTEARALRACVFDIFDAERRGNRPAPAALARINRGIVETAAFHRIARTRDGYAWTWDMAADPVGAALGRIALSAADLLASERRSLVRQCRAESCAWLFVDGTKNRSRVWCDMAVCGNRAKARRHGHARR